MSMWFLQKKTEICQQRFVVQQNWNCGFQRRHAKTFCGRRYTKQVAPGTIAVMRHRPADEEYVTCCFMAAKMKHATVQRPGFPVNDVRQTPGDNFCFAGLQLKRKTSSNSTWFYAVQSGLRKNIITGAVPVLYLVLNFCLSYGSKMCGNTMWYYMDFFAMQFEMFADGLFWIVGNSGKNSGPLCATCKTIFFFWIRYHLEKYCGCSEKAHHVYGLQYSGNV